ncbi:uncharacterized protein LOC121922469 [Sceloporus undulatus]|uniref:uncharacterized protein LOC121922469 n=1 Tax=Sceloporus undulatus TaxID=8520 RepID=UPI001C4C7DF4|nr:uncharacterized protein LOC121922469 [Sceloporus undulatus]
MDDVRSFADRVIRMADALKLEVAHPEDDALDPVERRIHGSAPAPPALAYLPSLEKIAKRSWDAPATIPSTSRRIENLYRVTPSAPSWLSNHPKLNSAIVEGAQSTFAPKSSSSPIDKDSKKLDGLAKKFYASAALDLKVANYAACMGAYVQYLVEKMDPTIADLPDDRRRMMSALRNEIHLISGQQIISARHSTDCASKILSGSIALRRYAWLRSSNLTPQAKAAIEDMPFDNSGLFHRDTDEKLSFRYRMKTAARKHGRPLVRDSRLKRCLLSHRDPARPPQVPRLCRRAPGIPVQGPSLRPFHSSKSLHQVHGTCGGIPASKGNHGLPILRRLALRSALQRHTARTPRVYPVAPSSIGTTGQLRQVQPDSHQTHRLHWNHTGLCVSEGIPSRGKVSGPPLVTAAVPASETSAGPCGTSCHGTPGLYHLRHTVGQTKAQAPAIMVPIRVRPRPRHAYQTAHHPEDRTEVPSMVAPARQRLRGNVILTPATGPLSDYGRLPAGMGRPYSGPHNKGQVVTGGSHSPHQRPRDAGCGKGTQSLPDGPRRQGGASSHRQHHGHVLPQQARGYKVEDLVVSHHPYLGVVHTAQDPTTVHPSARRPERPCRSTQQVIFHLPRMEAASRSGDPTLRSLGTPSPGLVRIPAKRPRTEVLLTVQRARVGRGCLPNQVDSRPPVCLSSISSDHTGDLEDVVGPHRCNFDNSVVAQTAVVRPSPTASTGPSPIRTPARPAFATRRASPPSRDAVSPIGGMEDSVLNTLPSGVRDIIKAAQRPSTQRSYAYKWDKFLAFLQTKDIPPSRVSIPVVLDFLMSLAEAGLSLSSIKCYLSAISSHYLFRDNNFLFLGTLS